MRILMLTTNYGKGGAERVFHDHAVAFSSFAKVEEVVYQYSKSEHVYNSGLKINVLTCSDFWSCFGPLGRLISRSISLRKLVNLGGYDVVISHMDGANWVNILSFSAAKKVLVVHGTVLRDNNVQAIKQWFRRRLIFPVLYNFADCTVGVSEGIARELSLYCGVRNVCSIPNFFNLDVITRKARKALDQDKSAIFNHPAVLITSGRLAEQKKQTSLLDLLSELHKRGLKARLVILGDGELRETLIARSQELGLHTVRAWAGSADCAMHGDVYFLGYVSNPYQYLARSTLFLFPSGWEGFPLALCEAMIAGVPVLSSDCPTGPREILSPGTVRDTYDLRQAELAQNGVLLPMVESPRELGVWVDSVERLLADEGQREQLKKNAAQAMKSLDRDAVVGKWLALLERITHAKAVRGG